MNLYLTIDLGSSLIKVLHGTQPNKLNCLTIEPEVAEISAKIMSQYQNVAGNPVKRIFVGIGDRYWAVGILAKEEFRATANLLKLKSEFAVQRILAAVWTASQNYDTGRSELKIFMSCLLPPGEMQDRDSIESDLTIALKEFDTPSGKIQSKLKYFNCHPEGGGLAEFYTKNHPEIADKRLVIVMLGHRNLSCYTIDSGYAKNYQSSDLGFVSVIKSIQSQTSGYSESAIAEYVPKYIRAVIDRNPSFNDRHNKELARQKLLPMLLRSSDVDRQRELETLAEAIDIARASYWNSISQWLEIQLGQANDVVIGGGTCWLFAEELDRFIRSLPRIQSNMAIYNRLNAGLRYPNNSNLPVDLQDRFADAYCLWWSDLAVVAERYEKRSKKVVV
jgi:hypothetical protein